MSTVKIKKGDVVKVIAGKDKGKEGKIVSINAKKNTALVEGVMMIKKHTKPSATNQQGGIVLQEAFIDISNLSYIYKGKTTKIGYKFQEGKDGLEKVRFAKTTGDVID